MPLRVTVDHPLARSEPWLRWLRMHAVNPHDTFEVEVGQCYMMVHQYCTRLEVNRRTLQLEWRKYFDDAKQQPAYIKPFRVPLIVPPPW